MTRTFLPPHKVRKPSAQQYSHHLTLGGAPLGAVPNFLSRILDQADSNHCTAYTSVALREPITGKQYDPEAQWKAEMDLLGVPDAPNGVSLETALATCVNKGFTLVGATERIDNDSAYVWIHTPFGADTFDTLKTTMQQSQRPISVAVNWYSDWDLTSQGIIPHTQKSLLGGHNTKVFTFETLNGVEYACIQGSWGTGFGDNGIFRFDRYMANKCFIFDKGYLSDNPDQTFERLGQLNALLVYLKNLYTQLIHLSPLKG